ncbi:MAG: HEAT repeat domain-containing protein [Polyangiales bacterium]
MQPDRFHWHVLVASALFFARVANAEPAAAPGPSVRSAQTRDAQLRSAERALSEHDPDAVRKALQTLAELGSAQAATVIEARLHRGLPPALIEAAIASLVQLGKPSAEPVLLELTFHRRAPIRQQAVAALGALHQQSAQPTLMRALDDPNPEVRSAAASSLARVGNAHAIPALLRADERGVSGAMAAIGAIAGPSDAKLVLQRAAQTDVIAAKPALEGMLDRPSFPMKAKVDLIAELAKLDAKGAHAYLLERFSALKSGSQPELRQALAMAIKRMDTAAHAAMPAAPQGAPPPRASSTPTTKSPPALTAAAPVARVTRTPVEVSR